MVEQKKMKVKYKHLSWQLKVAVVGGFGVVVYFVLAFLYGFMLGFLGYY